MLKKQDSSLDTILIFFQYLFPSSAQKWKDSTV